jgi:hypothetical protein
MPRILLNNSATCITQSLSSRSFPLLELLQLPSHPHQRASALHFKTRLFPSNGRFIPCSSSVWCCISLGFGLVCDQPVFPSCCHRYAVQSLVPTHRKGDACAFIVDLRGSLCGPCGGDDCGSALRSSPATWRHDGRDYRNVTPVWSEPLRLDPEALKNGYALWALNGEGS